MLKYNFRIEKKQNMVQEIYCNTKYLSHDLTYISGTTSSEYKLVDGQTVYVAEDGSSEFHPYPIQVFDCDELGYVVYPNQKYEVKEYEYFGFKFRGFVFADGQTYIVDDSNKLLVDVIKDSPHWADEVEETDEESEGKTIDLSADEVEINTKYPIHNSIVNINGIDYFIDFDDEDLKKLTLKSGEELNIERYENANYLVKFFIRKKADYKVDVEHISFTSPFKYVLIDEMVEDPYNGKEYKVKKKYYVDELTGLSDIEEDTAVYKGEVIQVFTEWKDAESGNTVNVYLDDKNYSFKPSDVIKITNNTLESREFPIETDEDGKEHVTIYGVKYYVNDEKKKLVTYNGKEYELFSENDNTFYIIVDNSVILFEPYDGDENGNTKRIIMSSEMNELLSGNTYSITVYKTVTIGDVDYLIKNNSVTYDNLKPIKLSVSDVKGTNRLRCTFMNANGSDENINDAFSDIVNNHQNYVFELENKLFDEGNVGNMPTAEKDYSTIKYRIFKSISNINLKLNLNNRYDAKLHQAFVQERDFYDVERRRAINGIVDMEKDIYYPATKKNNKFINVDKIIIDLHFRSRNMEDWKINNSFHNKEEDYDNAKCNWNIIDYYNATDDAESLKPKINLNVFNLYQPSDLLYFLNFTDDDVFYQKDKIGKSFLRLSFFDSPNVKKQSLLATSTIFITEGELYKKFINNRINKGNFISVDDVTNKKDRIIDKNISVNFEPFEKNDKLDYSQPILSIPNDMKINEFELTFDENSRLSSSFVIKNKYESVESSEGFYLYLFKDYSNGSHERTIYLKVEFNHAGVGRTLTFTQPYKIEGDSPSMLDLSIEDDLNRLKSGCTLQDMYNWIFIPIKVKYDFNSKKYYYYLPDWLVRNNDDSTMRLNLYELKIADETKFKKE